VSGGLDRGAIEVRLRDPAVSVRRVAILDLIRLSKEGDAGAARALCEHLARESDEKSLVLIARSLGERGERGALGALARLRDDVKTPAAVAHAAILAHDRLERAGGPDPG
jgi:hypothetical protein